MNPLIATAMRGERHTQFMVARIGWCAVLLVMALRIAIAPGMMPDIAEDGSITVRICTDAGTLPQTIEIPFEREGEQQPHEKTAASHCPYGALAVAPLVPDSPSISGSRAAFPTLVNWPGLPGLSPGAAAPLPPSTGPPLLV